MRLLGRVRNIKTNEHGRREPGSGNLISSRLGISGEKYREKKGGEKSEGDGELRDPSISFGGDDGNETEEDSSSDEEARSGRGSSSTYEWLRRKRKDPTPLIQVVKCSIEGHQAETEVSKKQHMGKGLVRGNCRENRQQAKEAPNADIDEYQQREEGDFSRSRGTKHPNNKESLYATPKRDSIGWISCPDRKCANLHLFNYDEPRRLLLSAPEYR